MQILLLLRPNYIPTNSEGAILPLVRLLNSLVAALTTS